LAKITVAGVEIQCDDEDVERILAQKWHMHTGYPTATIDRKGITIQRFLMGSPEGMDVHHADFDKLNERRGNLVPMVTKEHLSLHANTPEAIERARNAGRAYSTDESNRKKRESALARWGNPDECTKMQAIRNSAEYRELKRAQAAAQWADPLARERVGVTTAEQWKRPGMRDKMRGVNPRGDR
jgi:hypothetical protein